MNSLAAYSTWRAKSLATVRSSLSSLRLTAPVVRHWNHVVENSAVSGAVCSAECHPFSRMKCGATVTLNFRGIYILQHWSRFGDVRREASNPTTKFCKY